MKKRIDRAAEVLKLNSIGNRSCNPPLPSKRPPIVLTLCALLMILWPPPAKSQQSSSQDLGAASIQGTVRTSDGKLVNGAEVKLEQRNPSVGAAPMIAKTGADGTFTFVALKAGNYQITAANSELRTHAPVVIQMPQGDHQKIDLVVEGSALKNQVSTSDFPSAGQAMEFADKPDFTVAGVTDWTAAGGHGSDSSLRTTEDLTRETLSIKPSSSGQTLLPNSAPVSDRGSTTNQKNADAHRQAAELAEKHGDPLAAVKEYEQAVHLDPSEQNYFGWGYELLLHRAVWQAQEIFQKGANAYPKSARMLTGLGTALFAGARYDDAALQLCDASDLNPSDPEPYILMGKVQVAAPNPLTCIEQRLSRFVQQQPNNSPANYLYAMAILKHGEQLTDVQVAQQAEALLTKAVTIDSKCGDAYLQLGVLSYTHHDFQKAIALYTKAVEADPQLADAHYRLGVAYDRVGETAKAKEEFRLHDAIKKEQADAIERERREIKQFRVVLPDQPANPEAH